MESAEESSTEESLAEESAVAIAFANVEKVVQGAEALREIKGEGRDVKDITRTKLGRLYAALTSTSGDLVKASKLFFWSEKEKTAPIIAGRPEFGSISDKTVAKALLNICTSSHFGRGGETVYDPAVRESVELKFLLPSAAAGAAAAGEDRSQCFKLAPILQQNAEIVAAKLFSDGVCKVVPDKLVVYSTGGHFDAHRDTVYDTTHIGTVVITLFTTFEGGQLTFPSENITTGDKGSVAAFYTDVVHQVEPVKSGQRLAITFRVLLTDKAPPTSELPSLECKHHINCDDEDCISFGRPERALIGHTAEHDAAALTESGRKRLRQHLPFAEQPFVAQLKAQLLKGPVVLMCIHEVPRAAFQLPGVEGFRGADRALAANLLQLGMDVRIVLLNIDCCTDPEYSPDDPGRTPRVITNKEDIDLEGAVFCRADDFEATVVESKQYVERTGNEAAPRELQYVCAGMLVRKL